MKYQITYVISYSKGVYHQTTFTGSAQKVKDYARAYGNKKRLAAQRIIISEVA